MTEDAHLNTPEPGDTVDYTAFHKHWGELSGKDATVLRTYPKAQKADIRTIGNDTFRGVPFKNLTVLRKAG